MGPSHTGNARPSALPPDLPPTNPYAASLSSFAESAPHLPLARAPLAGRGERLLARIVDTALYWACFVPAFVLAATGQSNEIGVIAILLAFVCVFGLFIYNLFLLATRGQTVAKRWFGIRIVRNDGSEADFGRIFAMRMLIPGLLGFVPLFGLVNVLWIFGDEQRCLHDLIADTVVVQA